MFKDEAYIYVKAGDGGKGCVSFFRAKYMPRGGPDGGTGGRGGDVIIRAYANCNTLFHLIRKRHYHAQKGMPGGGQNCSGRSGKSLFIKVPTGTLIKDENKNLIADLKKDGDEIVISKGGKGGRGNASFARATCQTPRYAEPGEKVEERRIYLELKLIADVGLVGFPNAGKSTLLSHISAAHPKIAAYPFTTLEPNLGIVSLSDFRHIVFADLPGIIEGAHQGVGLGDKFLRHIERTRVLIYLLDIAPTDGTNPAHTFEILRKELNHYSATLGAKPFVIAANKMDITEAEENFKKLCQEVSFPIYPISGVTGQGIRELLQAVVKMIDALPPEVETTPSKEEAEAPGTSLPL